MPVTAVAGVIGMAAATGLTIAPEVTRLLAYRPTYAWPEILRIADMSAFYAVAVGLLTTMAGVKLLMGKSLRAKKIEPVERAASDIFGHADWMDIREAQNLFGGANRSADARNLGGVVIGEAYRVDQDAPARRGKKFDPRRSCNMGQGRQGAASHLRSLLGWHPRPRLRRLRRLQDRVRLRADIAQLSRPARQLSIHPPNWRRC